MKKGCGGLDGPPALVRRQGPHAFTNGCKYRVLSYLRMRIADAKVRMGFAPAPLGDKFWGESLFYEKPLRTYARRGASRLLG